MASGVLSVDEVAGRTEFRRFFELPHLLHRGQHRWAPPLLAWDRWRLDNHRNPYFDRGDAAYFLLRRAGKPAGRIVAHVASGHDEEGWFGFYDVIDDPAAAVALVEAAGEWLRQQGCTSMTGPRSFTAADEPGLLVEGFDALAATGRPWHPPWYRAGLEAAGLALVAGSERRWWRLPAGGSPVEGLAPSPSVAPPPLAGPYRDARLLLAGPAGSVAAVPDQVSAAGGSSWALAKRAKRGDWEGAVVVHWDGPLDTLVPAVAAAAGAAGYEWVLAPWTPEPDSPPEAVHALLRTPL